MNTRPHLKPLFMQPLQNGQRGISMLFALIALAVLTLGAVALVRSVDTGMLVLGNLGFKRDAVAAGSKGTEDAIAWLTTAADLTKESPNDGYYPAALAELDATGSGVASSTGDLVLVNWDGNGCDSIPGVNGRAVICLTPAGPTDVGSGNKVRYVITRLCTKAGEADNTNSCATNTGTVNANSSSRGGLRYGSTHTTDGTSNTIPFRIITRTDGVRGTVAYTETLVHF